MISDHAHHQNIDRLNSLVKDGYHFIYDHERWQVSLDEVILESGATNHQGLGEQKLRHNLDAAVHYAVVHQKKHAPVLTGKPTTSLEVLDRMAKARAARGKPKTLPEIKQALYPSIKTPSVPLDKTKNSMFQPMPTRKTVNDMFPVAPTGPIKAAIGFLVASKAVYTIEVDGQIFTNRKVRPKRASPRSYREFYAPYVQKTGSFHAEIPFPEGVTKTDFAQAVRCYLHNDYGKGMYVTEMKDKHIVVVVSNEET